MHHKALVDIEHTQAMLITSTGVAHTNTAGMTKRQVPQLVPMPTDLGKDMSNNTLSTQTILFEDIPTSLLSCTKIQGSIL